MNILNVILNLRGKESLIIDLFSYNTSL